MNLKSFLRGWLTLTAIVTIGHAYQALNYKMLAQKLYVTVGAREVSPMYSRLFCQWNIFFALLRLTCVVFFDSKPLYVVTLLSFAATVIHFLTEVIAYRTTIFANVGVTATLVTSGISILLMCVYWSEVWKPEDYGEKFATNLPMELAALSKKGKRKTKNLL